jgi:hypothetical protein
VTLREARIGIRIFNCRCLACRKRTGDDGDIATLDVGL